ncbi:MAG: Fic family protein [Candidatus Sericytochromatia bacterium]|nr:Fic family protein [Candidatus Sericytochromatia bacterium]
MPRFESRWWEPDLSLGEQHRAARGFRYEAYVPDPVAGFTLALPLDLAQELEATVQAVAQLQDLVVVSGLEALSRQLLRAESIGSSRIEGLQLSQRRLARSELAPAQGDALARSVMGNIAAMEAAIQLGSRTVRIEVADLLRIHRQLLEGTEDREVAGRLRTTQNWIGGSSHSPAHAEFIPPPEGEVEPLLADLCDFLAREDLPAIVQAAVAHAQFETIHPFADGNGRVGRALIHTVLRRRGLTPHFVPPVSLVLATNATRYVEGLTAFRAGDALAWCRTFLRTLHAATEHAKRLNADLLALQGRWRKALGHPRSDSAAERLIQLLPAHPVLNAEAAQALVGASAVAVRGALNDLSAAGVLKQVSIGRRNRVWEATALLHLVDDLEWTLATPTVSGLDRRPAPPRPQG